MFIRMAIVNGLYSSPQSSLLSYISLNRGFYSAINSLLRSYLAVLVSVSVSCNSRLSNQPSQGSFLSLRLVRILCLGLLYKMLTAHILVQTHFRILSIIPVI